MQIHLCIKAGETSVGGLEPGARWNSMLKYHWVYVKLIIACFILLVFVSALLDTVKSIQEMYRRDCVLTGLRGHGCGHKTGGEDTGGG